MKAMIFAAGLGTRFKPWTDKHPKALGMVNDKSLLERNILYLQQYGIDEVVVNVHHFPEQIVEAIQSHQGWGSKVQLSDESDAVLETGGGLLKARPLLQGSRFLTLNVDVLTDVNLKDFLVHHEEANSLISLAVSERKTSRYLLFNQQDRLCGWENVSTAARIIAVHDAPYRSMAYSGMAIFESAVFDLIRFSGKFSLIDLYLNLAPDNKIAAYDHTGSRFIDVGKPESVAQAEAMFQ